jgi:hypothetical protein
MELFRSISYLLQTIIVIMLMLKVIIISDDVIKIKEQVTTKDIVHIGK